MKCTDFSNKLVEMYLEGKLNSEKGFQDPEMAEHSEKCPACKRKMNFMQRQPLWRWSGESPEDIRLASARDRILFKPRKFNQPSGWVVPEGLPVMVMVAVMVFLLLVSGWAAISVVYGISGSLALSPEFAGTGPVVSAAAMARSWFFAFISVMGGIWMGITLMSAGLSGGLRHHCL